MEASRSYPGTSGTSSEAAGLETRQKPEMVASLLEVHFEGLLLLLLAVRLVDPGPGWPSSAPYLGVHWAGIARNTATPFPAALEIPSCGLAALAT